MAARAVVVKTSKGDSYQFHHMVGEEEVSRLFCFDLTLISENDQNALEDMLGDNLTVELELEDGQLRYFNGYVSHFTYLGTEGSHARYLAKVCPWLWFLTRSTDCRIFQNKTVPEIVREVFQAYPTAEFDDRLSGGYQPRVYCVQYRETDFDFVSRLMEFEGISYFFEHENGKHTLVLSDDTSAHSMVPGYDEIPYFSRDDRSRRERDHIYDWRMQAHVEPGQITLQSFDYLKPKADLMSVTASPREHREAEGEIYDYPGCYTELDRGETLTQIRLDERHCEHLRTFGAGTAGGLVSGHLFSLKQYPRQDQNIEYMVVRVEHEIWSEAYRSESPDADNEVYLGRFEAMPSSLRFRPRQSTPKPIVQGPQTAIVTGKAGEEIWTNEHGCVKVQFHWDRDGKLDENTSCWVRVSQAWAGAGFGGIHIPRIGQEVIVDFLEGDPDKPMITGRVYNALTTVPYGLPGSATQSGIKSNSSKGGGGSNELRFEDKAGAEEVYLHAQKDEKIVVENDKTEDVLHDETISITNDRTETVGNNETLTVVADRTRDVGGNETVTISKSRADTVMIAEDRKVLGLQNQFVGAVRAVEVIGGQAHAVFIYDTWKVAGYRSVDVSQNDSLDVGGNHSVSITKNQTVGVDGNQTVSVKKDQGVTITGARSLTVSKGRTTSVTEDDSTTVGKTITISAGDTITIKNEKASITMADNGDITIVGENILIDSKKKMDVKVKNNLKMDATKILQN